MSAEKMTDEELLEQYLHEHRPMWCVSDENRVTIVEQRQLLRTEILRRMGEK